MLAADFLCGLSTCVGHNMIHTKAMTAHAHTHTHRVRIWAACCARTSAYIITHKITILWIHPAKTRSLSGHEEEEKKQRVSLTGFICFQFAACALLLLQISPKVRFFARGANDGTSGQ